MSDVPCQMPESRRSLSPVERSGFVSRNEIYTIPELARRLGVEVRTIREARRNGLKAKLFGKRRVIIRGSDLDSYLESLPDNPNLDK